MYRFKERITGVIHNYEPQGDSLILIKGNHQESFLQIVHGEGIITIDEDTAYDFVCAKENILFTNKTSTATYSHNTLSGRTTKLPYTLHIKGLKNDNEYLCYAEVNGKECFLVISLESLEEVRSYPVDPGYGVIDFFTDTIFISSKKRQAIVALYEFPNRERWKVNLHELASQEDKKTSIDAIHVANNSLVILFGHSVVCLSFAGTLKWIAQLTFRPVFIDLNGNRGMCVSFNNFCTIDLETGEVVTSTKIEHIEWKGRTLPFNGSHPQSRNGQLWCTIQTSGYNFIAALNQGTGAVEWVQHVETPHFISPPKFHKDNLYILDTGGNLFVYENQLVL